MRRKGLTIVQVGDPVLRQRARALTGEEIRSRQIRQLIEKMRQTMYDAPGVGLAAPQIGVSLQIAVIEDREEYLEEIPAENLAERERRPIPFQVLINPAIIDDGRMRRWPRQARFARAPARSGREGSGRRERHILRGMPEPGGLHGFGAQGATRARFLPGRARQAQDD